MSAVAIRNLGVSLLMVLALNRSNELAVAPSTQSNT